MKLDEVVEVNGKKYLCVAEPDQVAEIDRFDNGIPVLKSIVETKVEGTDVFGNPKRSVNVRVPCLTINMTAGNNG